MSSRSAPHCQQSDSGEVVPTPGSGSLESAAQFAISVLNAQVMSQGKEWDAKLAYTACKYLEGALERDRGC